MSDTEKKEMSFLEHLEELRWHIIRSVISIAVFTVAAFVFREFIFDSVILAPRNPDFFTNKLLCELSRILNMESLCINSKPINLINITMGGQFNTHMMVSFIVGLILSFPVIVYEIWKFISPALKEKERKYSRGVILVTSFLFLIGVLFGYYLIIPFSIDFLSNYAVSDQVVNQINLSSYISTISSIVLASGAVFELPILVYFLTKIGLLTPNFMRKYRRHAVVVIVVIAAIITPPDVFSQLLVSIPLYLLYEVSIFISDRIVKQKDSKKA